MVHLIFRYFLEGSLCLILFMAAYRVLIANITDFSWMRAYLLVSTVLSLCLPFIILPMEWSGKLISTESVANVFLPQARQSVDAVVNGSANIIQAGPGISIMKIVLFIAFAVYLIGVSYTSYLFVRNLLKIRGFIKKNAKVKEGEYWIVCLTNEIPAFSFFKYIFMNHAYKSLSSGELQIIKEHEMVHVKQYHTLDILFVELVGIVFWFNPIVHYLKKSLKEIHEYIVDEKIAGQGEDKRTYAKLLLTLASDTQAVDLTASFSGEHIKRRIQTLAKPRTSPKYKLLVFVLIPLAAGLSLSFSYFKNPDVNSKIHGEASVTQLALKKYCGIYFPTKKGSELGLKPMEIVMKDNKLFRYIETENDPVKRTVELQYAGRGYYAGKPVDNLFSYADTSARSIEFVLDAKKEVIGCALTKLVTKQDSNKMSTYLLLEGEYLKGKPGKSEQ